MKHCHLGRAILGLAAVLAGTCPNRVGAQSRPHTMPAIVNAAAAAKPEIGAGPVQPN